MYDKLARHALPATPVRGIHNQTVQITYVFRQCTCSSEDQVVLSWGCIAPRLRFAWCPRQMSYRIIFPVTLVLVAPRRSAVMSPRQMSYRIIFPVTVVAVAPRCSAVMSPRQMSYIWIGCFGGN